MTLTAWQGVGGPAGIPKPIIDRISGEIRKLVAKPDTKAKMNAFGSEPFYSDPEQTAALIRADIAKYGKIIKDANIKVSE
jgi:tripartite-type tricarboxylate transporter receptor subunit TctC